MSSIISVLMAIVGIVSIVAVAAIFLSRSSRTSKGKKPPKNRETAVRNAQKRLESNPNDSNALSELGDYYYQEGKWEEAHKIYKSIIDLGKNEINRFENNLRCGMSALKLGNTEEAYKILSVARSIDPTNFEVTYNLGFLEFEKKNYEKAVQILSQAKIQDPEHAPTLRTLGHSFFRMKKNKEAMANIRRAIEIAPNDKESLYTLAECYYEANQAEQALRVFNRLRGDPVMGASACLNCGKINYEGRQYEKAIQDFELGLKHEKINTDIKVELQYRLAQCYLKDSEIDKALILLRTINLEHPAYKDVTMLINKYQDLNANKNLQVFIMGPAGDFVALCRKIAMNYFQNAKITITNISVNKDEWADILAEVSSPKWSDVVMFRFIRSQGSIGELAVRDFQSHIKEVKAGKGICISAGTFSEGARRYTDARLIDLIEKDNLTGLLNTAETRITRPPSARK